MTNFEYIKTLDLKELGNHLCDVMDFCGMYDVYYGCECCPMNSRCMPGYNGWLRWLGEEHDTIYENDNR